VDRVEVIDRYTVALHMKQVDVQMLLTLAESIRGSMMPRELTDPGSLARRGGGIGTGPFMVENEYQYKVGITYKRNPDYWQFDEGNRLPYLDGRRIVVIPDNSASLTAFRTGKVDWGPAVPGGVAGLRAFMTARPTTLVQESVTPGGSGSCYCLRLDKEPWSDVRVRRAMSMAIDYESASQTINGQPALLMHGVIAGLWHGSDDRLTSVTKDCGCPWYTYDPKRAKALLAEAGFPNGFSTTLAFFAYGQSSIEMAELLASYWKAIGVDAKLLSQDYTVFRRNVDIGGWENIGYSFTCCGSVTIYSAMGALVPGGPKNPQMGFINDPKMTALAKEISASYRDEAKQRELLGQARAYYLDQVFITPQVAGTGKSVFAPRLRNFTATNKTPSIHEVRGWMWTWIDNDYAFNK
jgi:ABC-type transport system substrate-binding protein